MYSVDDIMDVINDTFTNWENARSVFLPFETMGERHTSEDLQSVMQRMVTHDGRFFELRVTEVESFTV